MRANPVFITLIIILITLGSWGLLKINTNDSPATLNPLQDKQIQTTAAQNTAVKQKRVIETQEKNIFNIKKNEIITLLSEEEFSQAASYVNEQYSELSSIELNTLKEIFIKHGTTHSDNNHLRKAQRLYLSSAPVFDGIEILDLLSQVSIDLKDWQTALDALLKSSLLETRPDVLDIKLTNLTFIASQLKDQFLDLSKVTSIKEVRKLYQSLSDAHPTYAQFQFELSLTYLETGDLVNAKQLLYPIQYDLNIGNAVRAHLEEIKEYEASITKKEVEKLPSTTNQDIKIKLIRVGNSFLVDVLFNGTKVRLLLDTGASITSLTPQTITRLRLTSTRDVIKLSTANGVTNAEIYLAKKVTLGKITINRLNVAEINLGNSKQFQGLLGTDLLNEIGGKNYSYLIDNESNTLIFRKKKR